MADYKELLGSLLNRAKAVAEQTGVAGVYQKGVDRTKSYSRMMGEANPEFEVTYSGFRNRETAEVLTKLATATCEATPDSPAGDYDIVPSGAEAENYEFTYVPGVLTVQAPVGVRDIKDDTAAPRDIYNIAGQRLTKPVRGVNIIDKNEDYCIVESGTAYGIARFDNIVEHGSSVKNAQITAG